RPRHRHGGIGYNRADHGRPRRHIDRRFRDLRKRRRQGAGCGFVTVRRSVILGCGGYLPEKVVTNQELAERVDTSDAWIFERTGIKRRHIVKEGECTSDLAMKAAIRALGNADLKASDLDLIVVATTTPDETFPSVATRIQARLGMNRGAAFD